MVDRKSLIQTAKLLGIYPATEGQFGVVNLACDGLVFCGAGETTESTWFESILPVRRTTWDEYQAQDSIDDADDELQQAVDCLLSTNDSAI